MSEGIDTRELEKIHKAIANLVGPLMTKFKGRTTYSVAGKLREIMQKEPGPSNSPVIWASEKQRIWYFASRRRDGLPLKYTRESDPWSKQSLKAWDISRKPTEAVLGNRASYSPWVVSSQYQSAQHAATGWTTDEQAADKVLSDGTVKRIVEAQLTAIINEAFRGLG